MSVARSAGVADSSSVCVADTEFTEIVSRQNHIGTAMGRLIA
jgi:hypothetical protein